MRSHLRDAKAFKQSYMLFQGVVNDHERELATVRKKVSLAEATKMRAEFKKARRGVRYERVSNDEEVDRLVEEDEDLDDEIKEDDDRLEEAVGHMARRGVVGDDDDETLSDLDALGDSDDDIDLDEKQTEDADARDDTASVAEESPASTQRDVSIEVRSPHRDPSPGVGTVAATATVAAAHAVVQPPATRRDPERVPERVPERRAPLVVVE